MGGLRNFFREHRRLVALLIGLALAMKVLIPAGYMLDRSASVPIVVICPDASGVTQPKPAQSPHSAHHHHGGKADHDGAGQGKQGSGSACPYSLLPMASLAAADAPLLAAALLFILALGFAPMRIPRLARNCHLRPPLRGPPALV